MSSLAYHSHYGCEECSNREWLESYSRGVKDLWELVQKHGKHYAALGLERYAEEVRYPTGQTSAWSDAFGGVRDASR